MPTLDWIGREAVINHHNDVPYRLLRCDGQLSAGEPDTGNLLIEGDNLEALKALLPYYAGQVKCIYIDPPYNIGREDWKYNDQVNSPYMRSWLGKVVGRDDLSRHDKWLCMMYPRLAIAEEFLADEGAIFVSIDDTELPHLRLVMDEIFGASNLLACFAWQTEGNFDNQAKVKIAHEYILAYAKDSERFPYPPVVDPTIREGSKLFRDYIRNTIVKNGPKNPVSDIILPIGFPADFEEGVIHARNDQWPHYLDDAIIKNNALQNSVTVRSGWSSKRIFSSFIDSGFKPVPDSRGKETTFTVISTGAIESIKARSEAQSHVISVLRGVGTTQQMSATLANMGLEFDYPKPLGLVKYLISMADGDDFIVMDFFAGSGTTAHAVLELNAEDGGGRRFILVEIDRGICRDILAQRLRCIIQGYEYSGTERTPLFEQKLTIAAFKNSADILNEMDSVCQQHQDEYSGFERRIEDGRVILCGKKEIEGTKPGLGGGFRYCTLGTTLFDTDQAINPQVAFADLAAHIYFTETHQPLPDTATLDCPKIGVFQGTNYYLFFDGVRGGSSLDGQSLSMIQPGDTPAVVYADTCTLSSHLLRERSITFKHIPYEVTKR